MALFSNYHKPGLGVSKNAPYEANRFTLYFQLLGRKFWNICLLNLIMTLFTLPYIGVSVALYHIAAKIPFFMLDIRLLLIFIGLPFGFYGPVIGATAKIARDFVREEPVFIFSDFFGTVKKNIGKPIIISFISYFFFSALTFALPTYYMTPGIGIYVLFPLSLLATYVLVTIQFTCYTMSVCLELSVKYVLKNALIFSFITFFNNVLLLVILFLLLAICVFMLMLSLAGYTILFGFLAILLACFFPAYFIYSAAFITHPSLQRYVVEPYYQSNPQQTSAVLKQSTLEHDSTDNKETKDLPEYVYHNGRMVHRSVLESESLFDDERKIEPEHK